MLMRFIFILGILLNFQAFSQIELKLRLLASTNNFVYCEPIPLELSWENKGKEGVMVYDRDPFDSPVTKLIINGKEEEKYKPWMVRVSKTPLVGAGFLYPGERVGRKIDFSGYRLSPGYYRIKFIAEFMSNFGGGYGGRIESDEVEFKIKEAVGEDLRAVEWAKGEYLKEKARGNDYITECYKITSNEILEKFPTSTYAGWVLKDTYSGALLSFKNVKDYLSELKLSFEEKKKKWINERGGRATDKGWIDPLPIAKDYIEKAERFLKYHPDFGRANVIYFKLFLAYLVTNEWQKAYEAGKKVEEDFPYEWAIYESNFKEVMKELKDQGLVNEKK